MAKIFRNYLAMNTNVVIIGQPNCGKSTLFNKLIGRGRAVTSPIAGTTRDVVNGNTSWRGKIFTVFDTGGFEYKVKKQDVINKSVQDQIQFALEKADIILFITNVRTGITAPDISFARELKKIKKPIILVANKADNDDLRQKGEEMQGLGLGKPLIISALTSVGTGDLLDKISSLIKKTEEKKSDSIEIDSEPIKVGLFGKPNVGKSSIINALIGEKKVIVSAIPGTTRDAIENVIEYKDKHITLIDSAGIKRKREARYGIEKFSIRKSLETIQDCNIILFILSCDDFLSRQDQRISERILESNASVIIIVNKLDLIDQKQSDIDKFAESLRSNFNFLYFAPIVFTSAKTDQNIKEILDLVLVADKERKKVIDKEELTEFLHELLKEYPPHRNKKSQKRPTLIKLIQFRTNPPKFNLYLEGPETIAPQYLRFLGRKIHEKYGFESAPLHISVARENK